jgi:hypothetical protein
MKPRAWSDSGLLGWKLLSFYSLGAGEQLKLCGQTEDWFCKESAHRNAGANYLFGCFIAACSHISVLESLADEEGAEEQAANVQEFLLELRRLPPREDASVWSFAALSSSAEWERLRRLARATLSALNLESNPPRRPFVIGELVEVHGYRSATKFRLCSGPLDVRAGPALPTSVSEASDDR